MNLLILDDFEILRNGLAETLKDIEGITYIDNFSLTNDNKNFSPLREYELIILDIKSKEGINIDFLTHMKNLFPAAVIVVFTGFGNRDHHNICLTKGADLFLYKENDSETLRN